MRNSSFVFDLLDPTGVDLMTRKGIAKRPGSLDGKRIGMIWNLKPDANVWLEELGRKLKEKFPTCQIVHLGITDCCIELPPGELETIAKKIDVGVIASGD